MELKCAIVFTLASLLSVTATPHGYGVKGGAAARAEAGAAAGAFSGVGLPLSISSGPGFSGSFSKSSSSSFASSSASSSANSFSFSGSGAGGFGLNTIGTPGSAGCSGGCQIDSKGIDDSHGSGSPGNDLQTLSGVKTIAAAGTFAGSHINSKDGTHEPCNSGVCSGQKSPCGGADCKDDKTSSPDRDHKDCTSGHCGIDSESDSGVPSDCENGSCNGYHKKPTPAYSGSNDNSNCASGQCGSALPTSSKTDNFKSSVKCTSEKCSVGSPTTNPEKNYGSNNIPVTIITTPERSPNTGTYPGSSVYNQNQPETPASGTPSQPATHLTAPKQEEPCTHPNCKSPQQGEPSLTSPHFSPGTTNCVGRNCASEQSQKYPSATINYSYSQNTHIPAESPTPNPSHAQSPSNNVYPSPNCASGYCGSHPTHQLDHDIQVPIPSKSPDYAPNCVSGNCDRSPIQPTGPSKPTTPNYYHKTTSSENCASGNCNNPSNSIPSRPQISEHSQSHLPSSQNTNCASGNCGNYPSYQTNTNQPQVPGYSPDCALGNCPRYPSYQLNTNTESKVLISPQQPISTANCAFGNCGNSPSNQPNDFVLREPLPPGNSQGPSLPGISNCQSGSCGSYPSSHNVDSYYPRLPSYPQNISPNPPLNCASGNCANYPIHPESNPIGNKIPIQSEQHSLNGSPGCTSGTCTKPTYQHGSLGPSGLQISSHPGTGALPANCVTGSCAIYPSTQPSYAPAPGPKIPIQSTGNTPSTSYTGSHTTSSLPSGEPIPSRPFSSSGNCASGNCPNYPSSKPTSQQVQPTASNSPDKVPDFVALGVAGGTTNTGLFQFQPSTIPPSQPSGSVSHTSSAGAAAGTQSQSSILNSLKPDNDKEQVYTGGFGGPPGILKPYEFTAPTQNLASINNNKVPSQCSTGKCDTQSGDVNYINKHDIHSSGPCTSANCGAQSGKPHFGQSITASGAFATAATGSDDAVIYTGGFGGPPGILKPYDAGKGGNIAVITGAKHQAGTSLSGNHDAQTGSENKLNAGYGALSGAAATANAGIFGSGSYGGGHDKGSGCNSGCGSSEHGSYSGNFGLAGGITKSGLLEKLHNGVNAAGTAIQSAASAISGAGASSFALGGSFASSSASAHAVAGSAAKGGYGR